MSNAFLNHLQRIACKYMFKSYIVHNELFYACIYPVLKQNETIFCNWNKRCQGFSSREELEINLQLKFPSSTVNDKNQPPHFINVPDYTFNNSIEFYEITGIAEHVLKEHVQNCKPLI